MRVQVVVFQEMQEVGCGFLRPVPRLECYLFLPYRLLRCPCDRLLIYDGFICFWTFDPVSPHVFMFHRALCTPFFPSFIKCVLSHANITLMPSHNARNVSFAKTDVISSVQSFILFHFSALARSTNRYIFYVHPTFSYTKFDAGSSSHRGIS
jgi:hypothetical protein